MKLQGIGWSAVLIRTLSLAFCCKNTIEASTVDGIYSLENLILN